MGTSNSSPVRFIGQGPRQSSTIRSSHYPTTSGYYCGCLTVLSGDISYREDGMIDPPRTFTSKWRVGRSLLPCRERDTP